MEVPKTQDIDGPLIPVSVVLSPLPPQTRASSVMIPRNEISAVLVDWVGWRVSVKPKSILLAGAGLAESLGFQCQTLEPTHSHSCSTPIPL